jgi:coenzyme F420 hydrogenase subunit beta
LTGKEEDWMPIPVVATSKEEIISAAGTKYGASPNLLKLRNAVIDYALDNICIVGLPCHVKAVRHLQHTNFDLAPAIKFVIGLFCHQNFEYESMIEELAERGVNKSDVEKISVSKGVFHVRTRDTELSIPLNETGGWHSDYCQTCDDYSAELADISVGSKGSEEGWSSVILRTEKGEELFSELETKGYIKTKELDKFELLKKDSLRKRQNSV